jgi:hypothetical protein
LGEQFNASGQVGIGQTSIHAALDVNGGVRIGSDSTCNANNVGELIYTSGVIEYCYNNAWVTLASSSTTLTGVDVLLQAGSAAAPSLTFQEDTTTGLYQGGTSDYLFVTTGGVESAAFDNSGNFDITNASNTSTGAYQLNGTTILKFPDLDTNSIAVGKSALAAQSDTTGGDNTAVGYAALTTITNGADSTAVGYQALNLATAGPNTALGYNAGEYITAGTNNTALGNLAMTGTSANPLTGNYNTAIGDSALTAITTAAADNTVLGYKAGYAVTGGTDNTLVGFQAGDAVTGSSNIVLGESTTITSGSGNIIIGNASTKVTNSTSTQLDIGDTIFGSLAATAGGTALTVGVSTDDGAIMTFAGDGAITMPVGTTVQRPTGATGMIRYNTDSGGSFEGYISGAWGALSSATNIGSGTLGGGSGVLVELSAGSAAAPSLTFNEDTTTGLYQGGTSDYLFVTTGGVESAAFDNVGNFDITNGSATSTGAYQINGTSILALPDKDTTSIAVGKSALAAQSATSSGNTAIGDLALDSITTGTQSTAVGYEALYKTTGSPNEALGYTAGEYITAGADNIAIGSNAMVSTSAHPLTATSAGNIAIGDNALTSITGGAISNLAIGYNALTSSTINSTSPNLAIGTGALQYATTGTYNFAIGNLAMQGSSGNGQTGAGYNVALGDSALIAIQTTAQYNTAIGSLALATLTTGLNNTAIGFDALADTNGTGSIAIGGEALQFSTGSPNTAIGTQAGRYITTGTDNFAIGHFALLGTSASPITGNYNTALGDNTLTSLTGSATGSTAIGYNSLAEATAGPNLGIGVNTLTWLTTGTNNTAIGHNAMEGTSATPLTATSAGNTAIGDSALLSIGGTATNSTAIGYFALAQATAGPNTGIGSGALLWDTTGVHNTAIGDASMIGASATPLTGNYNLAMGDSALTQIGGAAADNTAIGFAAGYAVTGGTDNTLLGYQAGDAITGNSNIVLGESTTITSGNSNIIIGNASTKAVAGTSTQLDIGDTIYGSLTATAGGTALTIGVASDDGAIMTFAGEGAITMPVGTTVQRPTGTTGMIRYNTDSGGAFEGYISGAWGPLSSATNIGSGTLGGPPGTGVSIELAAGSAAAPSLTFNEDTTTGLYQGGTSDYLFVTTGGVESAAFDNAGNFDITNATNTSTGAYQINGTSILALPDKDTTSIAVGKSALAAQSATGSGNTAVGDLALATTTNGADSTAVGYQALNQATGSPNTAMGFDALEWATSGASNTALGNLAMAGTSANPLTGNYNTAIGDSALTAITAAAADNTVLGYKAGYAVTGGTDNILVGYKAGLGVTGSHNIILGEDPSSAITSGSSNILIGNSLTKITNTSSQQLDIADAIFANLSNGYVGIETNNPLRTLDVSGTYTGTTLTTGSTAAVGIMNTDTTANNFADLAFQTEDLSLATALGAKISAVFTSHATSAVSADLAFLTKNAGTTSEKMRITSGGLVGIGTTSPASSLDLSQKTDAVALPDGTSAQRPTAAVGMIRYNSTLSEFEGYGGSSPAWGPVTTTTNITGTIGASGSGLNVELAAGSAANPSLTFNEDTTTGLYQGGTSDYLFVTTGGVESAAFDNSGNFDITNGSATSTGAYQINGTSILALPDKDTTSIAVGKSALAAQSATSSGNVAVGDLALTTITTGTDSTAVGYQALNQATGSPNSAMGYDALEWASTGTNNTAIGNGAMQGSSASPMTGSSATNVGGNTAIGDSALYSLQGTATDNTAIGFDALRKNTTGLWNTGVGFTALYSNTTGGSNTAVGWGALFSATGGDNTAVGENTGEYITSGGDNIAIGVNAMEGTSANPITASGGDNIAIGVNALTSITGGATSNVAIGYNALNQSTVSSTAPNTAMGYEALQWSTTSTNNTAIGNLAMQGTSAAPMTGASANNIGGNVAVGDSALKVAQGTNHANTAIGYAALENTTTGGDNTAVGSGALYDNTVGNFNVAVGYNALYSNAGNSGSTAVGFGTLGQATGAPNTTLGYETGEYITTGSDNIAIGASAMAGTSANPLTGSYNVAIGDSALTAITTAAADNTVLGYKAGTAVTGGTDNTLVGFKSGYGVTGNSNIILGEDPSSAITSGSSNILIGNSLTKPTNSTSTQLDIGDTIYGSLTATAGGTALTVGVASDDGAIMTFAGEGAITLPDGTSAQRPTAAVGMIRYNSTLSEFEGYGGSSPAWGPVTTTTNITGTIGASGSGLNVELAAGSAAAPSLTFNEDTTTGLYHGGTSDYLFVTTGGTESAAFDNSGNFDVTNGTATSTGAFQINGTSILALPDKDTTSIAVGKSALAAQSATSSGNTAVGDLALTIITTGTDSTAVG